MRRFDICASDHLQLSQHQPFVLLSRDRKGAVVAKILTRDYFQLPKRQFSIASKRRMDSIRSPNSSMRIGLEASAGKISKIPPRSEYSPTISTGSRFS